MSWVLGALLFLAPQDRSPVLDRSPSEWARAEEARWVDWDPTRAEPPRLAARGALSRALEAEERRDLTAALEAWFALLEEEPDYPPALYQAGVVYFRLRRYSDAATAFERYLLVAPHRVGDTRALGHCHYSLGRYSEAATHYERVLSEGESPGVRFGLALARLRLWEEEAALKNLERVVELDSQHVEAHIWIGQLHFDAGRTEEARAALERAQALDPFAPRPCFLLSRVFLELGDADLGTQANELFRSLERVAQEVRTLEGKLLYRPNLPAVHRRLVELHAGAGDLVRVRGALARWGALDPKGVSPRIAALRAWDVFGRSEEASAMALGLSQVAGDSVEAWRALVGHYRSTKERVLQVRAEERLRELLASRGSASKN